MSLSLSPISILSLPNETVRELASHSGCQFEHVSTLCNAYEIPADIPKQLAFKQAIVPGTITQLIKNTADAANLDQQDHWLRAKFNADLTDNAVTFLQFDGLLTHADVFLNGDLILQSHNAFHTHVVAVTKQLKTDNQLYICFRAIAPFLSQKQPRARFPTRLVNQRHLRFIRTPTLGYMLGFASQAKLIGAFRPIKLITQQSFIMQSVQINTVLMDDKAGKISVKLNLKYLGASLNSGFFVLVDELSKTEVARAPAIIHLMEDEATVEADFKTNNIQAYWPHTHGMPKRYLLKLALKTRESAQEIMLGRYGFRSITRPNPNNFALQINNSALFLRGACWTPMNPLSLQSAQEDLRQRLMLLKQAGINMLRLPGNMPYECDDFYEMCDELGILIMQDFAFTNFDYPEDSAEFVESVKREAVTFLAKHGNRACLTVLAGNSEVAQQAAMMGVDLNKIHHTIFDDALKNSCTEYAPNVPYVSSSPNAEAIPFHAGNGTSHYYGVGGYKRSFEDARLFKGQFIAECLAFSHVPEDPSLYQFYDNEFVPTHHPRWKEGVPRDNGAGWDFADITDFYIEQLFGVNVAHLRATQPQRYLDYCRATSCEVVERTMNILRADSAQGRAALVWYLHDLKQGAGWGYIDSIGVPKSAFYGLARASQPTSVLLVDEGLEGLAIYLAHDGATALDCHLEIALITADGKVLEQQIKPCQLAARATQRISIDSFLGRFVDSSYAYRFGSRSFVTCVAKLTGSGGKMISQKVQIDSALTQAVTQDIIVSAKVQKLDTCNYLLTISVNKPLFFAAIDIANCTLSDNYLHIMPGFDAQVLVRAGIDFKPYGRIRAFNTNLTAPILFKHICN